jgi:hypothetical protein
MIKDANGHYFADAHLWCSSGFAGSSVLWELRVHLNLLKGNHKIITRTENFY